MGLARTVLRSTVWLIALSFAARTQTVQSIHDLQPTEELQRQIAGGDLHAYRIAVVSGSYMEIGIYPNGIDLALRVFAPDGDRVQQLNSPRGPDTPRSIRLVARSSGHFVIVLLPIQKDDPGGRYTLRVEHVRPSTPDDRQRVAEVQERVFSNQGVVTVDAGQSQKQRALKLMADLEEQAEILATRGDKTGEANLRRGICGHLSLLDPTASIDCLSGILTFYRQTGDRRGQLFTLRSSGTVHRDLGKHSEAHQYLRAALTLSRSLSEARIESDILLSLAQSHAMLGEHQVALDYAAESASRARGLLDILEIDALRRSGLSYQHLGQPSRALFQLGHALLIARISGDRGQEVNVLDEIGLVRILHRDHSQAISAFYESVTASLLIIRVGPVWMKRQLGEELFQVGNLETANKIYTTLLDEVRGRGDPLEVSTLLGLARVEDALGNHEKAKVMMESSLSRIEQFRHAITSEALRTYFFSSLQKDYATYIDLLMRMHKQDPSKGYETAAFEASERMRARVLADNLAEARLGGAQATTMALFQRERALRNRVNELAEKQLRSNANRVAAALRKDIDALLLEHDRVRAQIREASPNYPSAASTVTARMVQNELVETETVLLEYALGDDRSYVWAVTADTFQSFTLVNRESIEAAAGRMYELMTARNRRVRGEEETRRAKRIAEAEAAYRQAARTLSEMILGPLVNVLGRKRLIIVSDGALQSVPFGALPNPQPEGGQFVPLIEENEIVNLPSASILPLLRTTAEGRKSPPKTVAILADPVFDADDVRVAKVRRGRVLADRRSEGLARDSQEDVELDVAVREAGLAEEGVHLPRLPFTRGEAEAIYRLAGPGMASKALDFEANLTAVMGGGLAQYRILHIATHGLLNSQHPEVSGLVLSLVDDRGQPRRGFLKAQEISSLNLPIELVVMSACRTGLGRAVRGEGLLGLTRAFMQAGAKRIVASLWNVDDEATAALMELFYRGMLADGLRPAEALRRAQLDISKRQRWSSPYYWAGFILHGEIR
jgi:CHAT domain-containing protein